MQLSVSSLTQNTKQAELLQSVLLPFYANHNILDKNNRLMHIYMMVGLITIMYSKRLRQWGHEWFQPLVKLAWLLRHKCWH